MIKSEYKSGDLLVSDQPYYGGLYKRLTDVKLSIPAAELYRRRLGITVADYFEIAIPRLHSALVAAIAQHPTEAQLLETIKTNVPGRSDEEIKLAVNELMKRGLRELILRLSTFKTVEAVNRVVVGPSEIREAVHAVRAILTSAATAASFDVLITEAQAAINRSTILSALYTYDAFTKKANVPVTEVSADHLFDIFIDIDQTTAGPFFRTTTVPIPTLEILGDASIDAEYMGDADLWVNFLLRIDSAVLENRYGSPGTAELGHMYPLTINEILSGARVTPLQKSDDFAIRWGGFSAGTMSGPPSAGDTDPWSTMTHYERANFGVCLIEAMANIRGHAKDLRPEGLSERELIGTQPMLLNMIGTTVSAFLVAYNAHISQMFDYIKDVKSCVSGGVVSRPLFESYRHMALLPSESQEKILSAFFERIERNAAKSPTAFKQWLVPMRLDLKATRWTPASRCEPIGAFTEIRIAPWTIDPEGRGFKIVQAMRPNTRFVLPSGYKNFTVWPGREVTVRPTLDLTSKAGSERRYAITALTDSIVAAYQNDPFLRDVIPLLTVEQISGSKGEDFKLWVSDATDVALEIRREYFLKTVTSGQGQLFLCADAADLIHALSLEMNEALTRLIGERFSFPGTFVKVESVPVVAVFTDSFGLNGHIEVLNDATRVLLSARYVQTEEMVIIREGDSSVDLTSSSLFQVDAPASAARKSEDKKKGSGPSKDKPTGDPKERDARKDKRKDDQEEDVE